MAKHLQRELETLKNDLLSIGTMVQEAIDKAISAFEDRRGDLAKQVIGYDKEIDRKEVEIEEKCLKLLALYQPVAEDLRFIAAVIRINNDLERMGDYAVSIAERAEELMKSELITPKDLKEMAVKVKEMVRNCLEAFVKRDSKFAREICVKDDAVDQIHRKLLLEVRDLMKQNPKNVDAGLDYFITIRRLERIADMSTNIAQDVVYMVDGEIIRHNSAQYPRKN